MHKNPFRFLMDRPRTGRAIAAALLMGGLSACVPPDYPEDPRLSDESHLTPPSILPLDEVTFDHSGQDAAVSANANLEARGEDLRRRADAVRASSSE